MKTILLLGALAIMNMIPGVAQVRLGLNFDYYKPANRFADNIDSDPAGISLTGLFPLPNKRLTLGAGIGVAMYADRSYDYELVDEGAPGEVVEVYEEDCFLHLNALLRYTIYQNELVQTFAEARAGFYTFFSNRMVKEKHPLYKNETEFHGTSVNTGLGGGLSLNLSHLFNSNSSSKHPLFLEISANYNSGSRASYRYIKNEDQPVQSLNYGKYRSTVNSMNVRAGLSIQL